MASVSTSTMARVQAARRAPGRRRAAIGQRMDAGAEQRFVGVDVAEAAQEGLVEQQRLQARAAPLERARRTPRSPPRAAPAPAAPRAPARRRAAPGSRTAGCRRRAARRGRASGWRACAGRARRPCSSLPVMPRWISRSGPPSSSMSRNLPWRRKRGDALARRARRPCRPGRRRAARAGSGTRRRRCAGRPGAAQSSGERFRLRAVRASGHFDQDVVAVHL